MQYSAAMKSLDWRVQRDEIVYLATSSTVYIYQVDAADSIM